MTRASFVWTLMPGTRRFCRAIPLFALCISVALTGTAFGGTPAAAGEVGPLLVTPQALTGTVYDKSNGAVIAGAQIDAWHYDIEHYDTFAGSATTDASGHYETLGAWGPGLYRLEITAEGYQDFTLDDYWIAENDTFDFHLLPSAPVNPIPLEGVDRFATAVQASKAAFPLGSDAVVIASGRNFPDALGGSALAGALNAPVLLVEQGYIPQVVQDEIDRLGAERAIIIGGEMAVGVGVWEDLSWMYVASERIAGADRYETARKVAERTVESLGPEYGGGVFIATGRNFPDALAAAPLAAWAGMPILLVTPGEIPTQTGEALASVAASEAVVLGGVSAVSAEVNGELESLLGASNVTRLGESDRYQTAVRIARFGVDELGMSWDGLAFATGANFPDALAGGAAQGVFGSVLLLTKTDSLPDAPRLKLLEVGDGVWDVYYLGGTSAISSATRASIEQAITDAKS